MLTGTAISSDTSMSHKYSLQWVAHLQITAWQSSTGMLQRPCCRVCVQHISICMRHLYVSQLAESTKFMVKGQHQEHQGGYENCVSWWSSQTLLVETFPTVSKQRHHGNLDLHVGKDQCGCCRLVTRIQNSASPFFLVCTLEQKEVSSSEWRGLKKLDSSSTVVNLKGHFTKQRYATKYQQPLHFGTQSRTLFAPFDVVWCQQWCESRESFKKAPL